MRFFTFEDRCWWNEGPYTICAEHGSNTFPFSTERLGVRGFDYVLSQQLFERIIFELRSGLISILYELWFIQYAKFLHSFSQKEKYSEKSS